MHRDNGFHALDRQECLRRLATVPIGRIVYTSEALPAVLPVNFALDSDYSVIIRTSAGSRLAGSVNGAVVAFEADQIDAATSSGWSVIVTGIAHVVTDPAEHRRLEVVGPDSWGPVADGVYILIEPELVTGRALGSHADLIAPPEPRDAASAAGLWTIP
ncbi:pyridoxamine 5'-phosphate oxidase family protein [Streptomyces albus]|uniref:pyridoxamine 5'-phosphate oxidase family protein n=1 Tax=Streptomyces albus TaxID=1888 RepID=UPI000690B00E|nr:pyridoxamine 5'-phosphate oxidase family protein [Streptomyces albus]